MPRLPTGHAEPVISLFVMELEFWVEGDHDVWAEYKQIRVSRPDVGKAIRNAITLVRKDPDTAEQDYSVRLDPDAGYLGLPFESPKADVSTWSRAPTAMILSRS